MLGLVGPLLLSLGLGPTLAAPRAATIAPVVAGPHLAVSYFGARYYGAKTGRFTAVDPVYNWNENLLDPQRWNRYAYGRNNPLRYLDPDGRDVMIARPPLSQQTLARNAAARASIADAVRGIDKTGNLPAILGAHFLEGLIAPVFPLSTRERDFNDAMALATPPIGVMEMPAASAVQRAAALTMDEAVALGARHVEGQGIMETTAGGNFQFRNTVRNAAGEVETTISRFDVNPASRHVRSTGAHLNREVHVNGLQVKNLHTPIDPKTVRVGDHP